MASSYTEKTTREAVFIPASIWRSNVIMGGKEKERGMRDVSYDIKITFSILQMLTFALYGVRLLERRDVMQKVH